VSRFTSMPTRARACAGAVLAAFRVAARSIRSKDAAAGDAVLVLIVQSRSRRRRKSVLRVGLSRAPAAPPPLRPRVHLPPPARARSASASSPPMAGSARRRADIWPRPVLGGKRALTRRGSRAWTSARSRPACGLAGAGTRPRRTPARRRTPRPRRGASRRLAGRLPISRAPPGCGAGTRPAAAGSAERGEGFLCSGTFEFLAMSSCRGLRARDSFSRHSCKLFSIRAAPFGCTACGGPDSRNAPAPASHHRGPLHVGRRSAIFDRIVAHRVHVGGRADLLVSCPAPSAPFISASPKKLSVGSGPGPVESLARSEVGDRRRAVPA